MARPLTANYSRKPDNDPDNPDHILTIKEYLGCVECGGFIDYDGYGEAVKDGLIAPRDFHTECDGMIIPSLGINCIPSDATHIIWYNR